MDCGGTSSIYREQSHGIPKLPCGWESIALKSTVNRPPRKKKIYLVLNKERGVVTTASDEQGRATVYDSLPEQMTGRGARWIAPVGRLDKASEGLLLMTNDSEWAARITAPESHLDKIYHVQIATIADDGLFEALKLRRRRSRGASRR